MKKKASVTLSLPAILAYKHEGVALYVTAIKAKQIFAMSAVDRAEDDSDKGYQRFLNEHRASKIAKYVDDGNLIPGAIILSAQERARFAFDKETNQISFKARKRAFLVIDGQHRLYGAHLAKSDIKLPVSILVGLSFSEEVRYFNDINTSQKGVSRTLQLAILKFLTPIDSPEQIRLKFFNALNTRATSPLVGRLSATKTVAGKLTLVPFSAAFDPLLKDPFFLKLNSEEDQVKMLINFLSAVRDVLINSLGNADKLVNSAFFQALFRSLPAMLNVVAMKYGNFKRESFDAIVEPLENIEWEFYTGTNRKTIDALSKHITALVSEAVVVSDDAV